MGIEPTFPIDKEKGLSVARLQGVRHTKRTHLARCPTPQNHKKGTVFARREDDTRYVSANGPREKPEVKHSDESLTAPWLWRWTHDHRAVSREIQRTPVPTSSLTSAHHDTETRENCAKRVRTGLAQ